MNLNDLTTKDDLVALEKKLTELLQQQFNELQDKMGQQTADEFLTRKQVQSLFQISDNTFTKMLDDGLPYIMVSERTRYDKADVVKFLKGNKKLKTLSITKVGK